MECLNVLNLLKKIIAGYVFFLSFLFLYGCSGDNSSEEVTGDSGAISFEIQWPDIDPETELGLAAISTAEISCMSSFIKTITFAIYDKDNHLLVDMADATFNCSDGEGVVEKVPAGSGIRLVILAKGFIPFTEDEVIYLSGDYPEDITVEVGKTASLGIIDTYGYTPTLSRPLASASIDLDAHSFEWHGVNGASTYKINITRQNSEDSGPVEYMTSDTTFTLPSLENDFFTAGGSYLWYVTAVDAYENYGPDTVSRHFTISK